MQTTYPLSNISVCTCVMCMYPGVSLYVPVCVSWSISYLRGETSGRSLGRSFARLPQTSQMCIGNTVTKNEIRSNINFQVSTGTQGTQLGFQLTTFDLMDHLDYGRLRSESVDRSEPREGVWRVVCPVIESNNDLYL